MNMSDVHAFDENMLTDEPCPVCLKLAFNDEIQPRGVMPLPKFPPRLRSTNEPCCYDCQAAETTQMFGNNPIFSAARLTVSNERIEGLAMPPGLMKHFGLCQMGFIRYCSQDDFEKHTEWLKKHHIENDPYCPRLR